MALWLNGPFGVGKTTVARELVRTGAVLVDPERLGFVLRRTIGRGRDYQDLAVWRRLTGRQVARQARRHPSIVVAMSVLHPPYLAELLARVPGMTHVLLDAQPETVRARAAADVDDPGARAWRLAQVDRYIAARDVLLAVPGTVLVATDGRDAAQVAEEIRSRTPRP